jgi:hypothetical protein
VADDKKTAKKTASSEDEHDAGATQNEEAPDNLVGQADVSEDRPTDEVGAPGQDVRTVAEALVEADKDGVPRAKGDNNAMLTGVNADILNPAFGGPKPPTAEDADEG